VTRVLIHIGYQKTATKWLRDKVFGQPKTGFGLLTQHIPAIRELAFGDPLVFDAEATRAALAPKLAELEQAGLTPALSWGRLVGVAFSGGHDTKPIADNLAQTFPGARIVVVMREQRSMVVSTYKQYVKTGGPARLETFLSPDSQHKAPTFRFEFFEYDRVIRYYRSLFGADAVLAMPYEQLAGDRAGFITQVAEFGGRPVEQDVLRRIVKQSTRNTAQSALVLGLTRPLNLLSAPTELNPAPVVGSKRITAITARARRKLDPADLGAVRALADRSERRLREKAIEAIGDRYVESNRRTAALTGIDLAQYGWMV
jgi:hypothetical protein